MTTLLLSRPPWVDHQTPLWHPERQDRMRAVESALEEESFAWLVREEAAEAALQMLALVHPEPYIQSLIDAEPLEGLVPLPSDYDGLASDHFPAGSGTCPTKQTVKTSGQRY